MNKIISQISEGVSVSVQTFYQPEYSNPLNHELMFAYRITLENLNKFPVKLISRSWHIFDSNGTIRLVQGDGVVGAQPTIEPFESYEYVSGCNLKTEVGRMHGSYTFENLYSHQMFQVQIPVFEMFYPWKMN